MSADPATVPWNLLAVAATAAAERLASAVNHSSTEALNREDADLSRRTLDCLWRCARENRPQECLRQAATCLDQSPLMVADEEPPGVAAYGSDVLAAILYAARAWLDESSQEARWGLRRVWDSFDFLDRSERDSTGRVITKVAGGKGAAFDEGSRQAIELDLLHRAGERWNATVEELRREAQKSLEGATTKLNALYAPGAAATSN